MTAKALDVIVGQSFMDKMNHTTEQMAKMVAAFKTTAWRDKHGSLDLVLDDAD